MENQNTTSLFLIQIALIIISVSTCINIFKISKLEQEIISFNYSYNESKEDIWNIEITKKSPALIVVRQEIIK